MTAPNGTKVEVSSRARYDILLSRGYVADRIPETPRTQRADVSISANAVVAPWDESRVANASSYEIPNLNTISDDNRDGCWPTVRRAWENGARSDATHHLVLTDDLKLAEGFWDALNTVVSMFPESPISLFSVKKLAPTIVEIGLHWCISWGVTGAANVLPVSMIDPFLEWNDDNIRDDCPHDDVRLTAFITAQGIGALTPLPCLVDHGSLPSVLPNSPVSGKCHSPAAVFQDDVTGIDWSKGAYDPVFVGISVDRPDAWFRDGRTLQDLRR